MQYLPRSREAKARNLLLLNNTVTDQHRSMPENLNSKIKRDISNILLTWLIRNQRIGCARPSRAGFRKFSSCMQPMLRVPRGFDSLVSTRGLCQSSCSVESSKIKIRTSSADEAPVASHEYTVYRYYHGILVLNLVLEQATRYTFFSISEWKSCWWSSCYSSFYRNFTICCGLWSCVV